VNTEQSEAATAEVAPSVSETAAPDAAMEVLRSHVPLSLLMDIASADGPDSAHIAKEEGGNADWLQPAE
jgi:hypothetical protein